MIENLGRTKTKKEIDLEEKLKQENKPKAPLPAPPKVKIGDHVKLARGRTGIVKYIGETEFSKGKELIGLELDTYDAEGAERHKNYFDAPAGLSKYILTYHIKLALHTKHIYICIYIRKRIFYKKRINCKYYTIFI